MSLLKHVVEIADLLEDPRASGEKVEKFFSSKNLPLSLEVERLEEKDRYTDIIVVSISGEDGKERGGGSPTLGVVGRLGGIGARPEYRGLVSDADGAIVALSVAYKIAELKERGDILPGDVVVVTHICPRAPVKPYKPVPMMWSPVDIFELLRREARPEMDAVLSVDATKANWVVNYTGFAITPTIKEGWILKPSEDLLDIYTRVTGEPPVVIPITMQDILPYTTPVHHINSMVQPWIYTHAPVVGVGITTRQAVPGSATGATNIYSLEQAARFIVEVAKEYTARRAKFYSEEEWRTIIEKHGSIREIMRKGAP